MTRTRVSPQVVDNRVRNEILAAARTAMQRYGFRKATMDDIAKALGKERSSLYYYFASKHEVVRALVEHEFSEMSRAVHAEVDKHKDAEERLRAYMSTHIEQVAQRCAVYRQTTPDPNCGVDIYKLSDYRRAFDESEQQFVAAIISAGIRMGHFKTLSQSEVALFTRFAFSALRGMELELMLDPSRAPDFGAQVRIFLDTLFRGLLR